MSGVRILDVRFVQPKDRLEMIMGACDDLRIDQAIELTVDHDPQCTYHALKAIRGGDDAFRFEYLEDGPDIWRVHVTKVGTSSTLSGDSAIPTPATF